MITTILSALARVLGPLLPFLAAWIAGKRDARQNAKIEGLEGYRKTRERMDDESNDLVDADLARKRLSERNPNQR